MRVAPSRVRGLKLLERILGIQEDVVAPSRVRGLKQALTVPLSTRPIVAPSRVRGLKRVHELATAVGASRTLTGAWIEARLTCVVLSRSPCRTLTGAWIEASTRRTRAPTALVAPSRVRGLKPDVISHVIVYMFKVAPSRVRGLKPDSTIFTTLTTGSHPHGCVD